MYAQSAKNSLKGFTAATNDFLFAVFDGLRTTYFHTCTGPSHFIDGTPVVETLFRIKSWFGIRMARNRGVRTGSAGDDNLGQK